MPNAAEEVASDFADAEANFRFDAIADETTLMWLHRADSVRGTGLRAKLLAGRVCSLSGDQLAWEFFVTDLLANSTIEYIRSSLPNLELALQSAKAFPIVSAQYMLSADSVTANLLKPASLVKGPQSRFECVNVRSTSI